MRLAVVNDLYVAVDAIRRVISKSPTHQLAWIARDGAEAVARCAEDRPDLILMDLIMPVMGGVEATRRIMAATPCPILVVTATVDGNFGQVYEALGAGALDAVNTPTLTGPDGPAGAAALLAKIDMLCRITTAGTGPPGTIRSTQAVPRTTTTAANRTGRWLYAIGASAGGPAALASVLSAFAKGHEAAIVIIQHLDESFAPGLRDWLGTQVELPVRIAQENDVPEPGVILLPGRADHLILTAAGGLAYTPTPAAYVYRPSIDVFFESVARHWRGRAAGVILTGMGRDGALGLRCMKDAGHVTLAQDRATSAVYGMPKAAAEARAAQRILPLGEIGPALRELL